MPDWKYINTTYIYDGTLDGLLTIIFECYSDNIIPINIVSEESYTPNFIDDTIFIKTDEIKAKRVFNGIQKNISYHALYNCYNAFLSNTTNKEILILKYIYHGFKVGPQIDTMLSIDYIFLVNNMRKRALDECHKLKGLVRFIELDQNLYYSSIHPDNYIIEPLGHHFMRRLPTQNFIIHDKIRNIAFLYNTKTYQIVDDINLRLPEVSEDEKQYQKLWKVFFETISIKERKNPRLQMQYMPKKYWDDLIEMQ